MKKRDIIVLTLLILFAPLLIGTAAAQTQSLFDISYLTDWISFLFRLTAASPAALALCFLFWLLLFIDLSKPLVDYTAFSKPVAWLLGLGLSALIAFSGTIGKIVAFLTDSIGFIGALIVILFFFVGSYIFEALISIRMRQEKEKEKKAKREVGEKIIEKIGGEFAK